VPGSDYRGPVRWDDLFDDLEGQAEAGDRAAWEAVLADLVSAERAAVRMLDRIRASRDPLTLRLVDGQVLAGPFVEVGEDWLILGVEEVLVPITAVVTGPSMCSKYASPHLRYTASVSCAAVGRSRSMPSSRISAAAFRMRPCAHASMPPSEAASAEASACAPFSM